VFRDGAGTEFSPCVGTTRAKRLRFELRDMQGRQPSRATTGTASARHAADGATVREVNRDIGEVCIVGTAGQATRTRSPGTAPDRRTFRCFFRWFGDILPKLEAVVRSCGNVQEYVVLAPAARDAPYVAESLAAYGVEHRVIAPENFVIADELCCIPRLTPREN
jgi:hypothetical protein